MRSTCQTNKQRLIRSWVGTCVSRNPATADLDILLWGELAILHIAQMILEFDKHLTAMNDVLSS